MHSACWPRQWPWRCVARQPEWQRRRTRRACALITVTVVTWICSDLRTWSSSRLSSSYVVVLAWEGRPGRPPQVQVAIMISGPRQGPFRIRVNSKLNWFMISCLIFCDFKSKLPVFSDITGRINILGYHKFSMWLRWWLEGLMMIKEKGRGPKFNFKLPMAEHQQTQYLLFHIISLEIIWNNTSRTRTQMKMLR